MPSSRCASASLLQAALLGCPSAVARPPCRTGRSRNRRARAPTFLAPVGAASASFSALASEAWSVAEVFFTVSSRRVLRSLMRWSVKTFGGEALFQDASALPRGSRGIHGQLRRLVEVRRDFSACPLSSIRRYSCRVSVSLPLELLLCTRCSRNMPVIGLRIIGDEPLKGVLLGRWASSSLMQLLRMESELLVLRDLPGLDFLVDGARCSVVERAFPVTLEVIRLPEDRLILLARACRPSPRGYRTRWPCRSF